MATYFADTSFWIAISSKRDQYHSQAVAWHQSLVRTASRIVTTEAVLWAWLNALSDAATRAIAAEGYRRVHADRRIDVVPFQPGLSAAAVELYRGRAGKNWSLTDCTSIAIMRRLGIRAVLTADHHFEQAGFTILLKP